MKRKPLTAAYRWNVAGRTLAASVGGLACASAAAIALSALLIETGAMTRPSAVHLATLLAFAVWAFVAMWCFKAATLARAARDVTVPTVAFAALAGGLL
jgi:hypothetical protein